MERFADLDRFWESATEPLSQEACQALVAKARGVPGINDLVVIPAGTSAEQILELPLRVRTRRTLQRSRGLIDSGRAVTAARLLGITNFGFTSLIDLLCVLEAAGGQVSVTSEGAVDGAVSVSGQVGSSPSIAAGGWEGAVPLVDGLLPVLALARDIDDCQNVAEALTSPRLAELMAAPGDAEARLAGLSLDQLPGGPVVGLIEGVHAVVGDLPDEHIDIFVRRKILKSHTLAALGEEHGVTRKRIRQIESRVAREFDSHGDVHASMIALVLQSDLGPIGTSQSVEERIDTVLRRGASACAHDDLQFIQVMSYLIWKRLDRSVEGALALSEEGRELVAELSRRATEAADDVGLVDLEPIVREVHEDSLPLLDELVELLGLQRVAAAIALRDTLRVRAKLALLEIGRPATKEEIAERAGLAADTLGSTLSNIDSIARSDRSRWGLVEWIDDVYEGIPAEIRQRIDEHGGAVPLRFLLEDIPDRFGVTEASVRLYAATRQFEVVDGMVSLASSDSISYRPVDDVAMRNEQGELCWEFPVEARYLEGFSIIGFPPELARELRCGPNDRCEVPVVSPDGCEPVSVIWRLTSVSGTAEIGRARDVLREIGAAPGNSARIVILDGGSALRFELGENDRLPTESSSAADLLERLKNRRRIS